MLRLAVLRAEKNLSQSDLAFAVSVSVETVQRWEKGIRRDRILRTVRLCQALDCEAGVLLARGLRAMREKANLTQAQLAETVGVSDRIIRAWESGEKEMEGLQHTVALCAALNCRTSDLVESSV